MKRDNEMEIDFSDQIRAANEGKTLNKPFRTPKGPKKSKAAEPKPDADETHSEYMNRCVKAGYTEEECMKAHEGHKFKDQDEPHNKQDHAGWKKKKY